MCSLQNLRNARANEVSSAIRELISAVRAFGTDFTDSEPDNMVTNIMEVGSHFSQCVAVYGTCMSFFPVFRFIEN